MKSKSYRLSCCFINRTMTGRTGTRAEKKINQGRKAAWEQKLSYVYFERVCVRTSVNEGEREHLKIVCFLGSIV